MEAHYYGFANCRFVNLKCDNQFAGPPSNFDIESVIMTSTDVNNIKM